MQEGAKICNNQYLPHENFVVTMGKGPPCAQPLGSTWNRGNMAVALLARKLELNGRFYKKILFVTTFTTLNVLCYKHRA